jgi:MATE family multidrug resistance protein
VSATARPALTDARQLLALGGPVIVGQVGSMMLGVVDTLMLGHYSTPALAAAALGNLWAFGTLVFGMGVIFGIDPIVSQAHGAQDGRRQALALQRGLLAALLVSVPIGVLWLYAEPALVVLGQERVLAHDAARFLRPQLPGLAAFLLFLAFRQYQLGRGIAAPAMWVILFVNLVHAPLDWALIFGHLGVPSLGLLGAGIATGITQVVMVIGLAAWTFGSTLHEGAWIPWSREAFHLEGLQEVLRHGLPVGVQYGLEIWAFQIATLWAGQLGRTPLGAHSVVLNMAALFFMIPFGLSIGAVTRVGNLIGAGDLVGARRASWVALALGAGVMTVSMLAFLLLRGVLPALYSADPEVRQLATAILPIAAAFQLFDGTQAVGGGVLRGMGNTRPAALVNLVGYYALALPLAWWLTFPGGLGLVGIWWGLALGLAIVAGLLVVFILRTQPTPIAPRLAVK